MARPKKPESEILLDVPCKVPQEVLADIEDIAATFERSKSFITRKFVMRGLVAYKRDGLFDEPAKGAANGYHNTDEDHAIHPTDAEIEETLAEFDRQLEADKHKMDLSTGGRLTSAQWKRFKAKRLDERRQELLEEREKDRAKSARR